MIVDPKKIKDKRRHLRRMVAKSKKGELDKAIVEESYTDWKAHIKRGNSFKITQKMDRYYKDLWKDEVQNDYQCCKKDNFAEGTKKNRVAE